MSHEDIHGTVIFSTSALPLFSNTGRLLLYLGKNYLYNESKTSLRYPFSNLGRSLGGQCVSLETVNRPKWSESSPLWSCTCCGNWAALETCGPAPAGSAFAPAALPHRAGTTTNVQSVKSLQTKSALRWSEAFITQNYSLRGHIYSAYKRWFNSLAGY